MTVPQLVDSIWVLRDRRSGTRQIADEWFLNNLDPVRVSFELDSTEAMKRVVAASDALGCLSCYAVAQSLQDGYLVELETRLPKATRNLAIALQCAKAVVTCPNSSARRRPRG